MLVNVKTKACNDAILGDLGRFPMYIKYAMNVFYILIASDNLNIIKNTAMYTYYALKEREGYLHIYL